MLMAQLSIMSLKIFTLPWHWIPNPMCTNTKEKMFNFPMFLCSSLVAILSQCLSLVSRNNSLWYSLPGLVQECASAQSDVPLSPFLSSSTYFWIGQSQHAEECIWEQGLQNIRPPAFKYLIDFLFCITDLVTQL